MQGQMFLKEKKLYNGEATGVYNDETRLSIKNFQKDNSLALTGNFNRATLERMKIALTDSQKVMPAADGPALSSSSGISATKTAKPTGSAKMAPTVAPTSSLGASKSTANVKPSDSVKSSDAAASTDAVKPADAAPKKSPIFRATPDQIKAAQKLLKEKSMYNGEETGKLDDATRDGLKKFQEGNGVKVTGTLNAVTLEKMGIPLTDKQKSGAPSVMMPTPQS